MKQYLRHRSVACPVYRITPAPNYPVRNAEIYVLLATNKMTTDSLILHPDKNEMTVGRMQSKRKRRIGNDLDVWPVTFPPTAMYTRPV